MVPVGEAAGVRVSTKAEQRHMERVQSIGCVVCLYCEDWGATPAEIHHMLDPDTNKRLGHRFVLPLCAHHHRGNTNNAVYTSRHTGQLNQFEARYLPESTLLIIVNARLTAEWPEHYPEEGKP